MAPRCSSFSCSWQLEYLRFIGQPIIGAHVPGVTTRPLTVRVKIFKQSQFSGVQAASQADDLSMASTNLTSPGFTLSSLLAEGALTVCAAGSGNCTSTWFGCLNCAPCNHVWCQPAYVMGCALSWPQNILWHQICLAQPRSFHWLIKIGEAIKYHLTKQHSS